jgi:DNA-binding beta-propeller fold protein YncE
MVHRHRPGSLPLLLLVVFLGASPETLAQPYLFVANLSAGNTSGYSIGATGALTPLSPPHSGVGSSPFKIAITANGALAYVANHGNDAVSGYSINPATGAWTFLSGASLATGPSPWGVAVSPNGKFLYVTNQGGNSVSAYTVSADGSLTAVAGSPFPAGGLPLNVAVTPNSAFVYVANNSSAGPGSVSGYAIDAATGALTAVPGSPFAAGMGPYGVAIAPNGAFAYVTNSSSGTISAFAINAATGALSPVAGSPFGPPTYAKTDIAITPNGEFAYTVAAFVGVIPYRLDAATGAMTVVAGSPFGSATSLPSVAVGPDGTHVYMTNGDSLTGNVSAFTINGGTGALTAVAGSPFAAGAQAWGIATANPAAVTSFTGPTATGSGSATVSFTGGGAACQFTSAAFIPLVGGAGSPPAGSAPSGVAFPHGLLDFATGGCTPNGATLAFTVVYPQPLAPGTVYWKYGKTAAVPVPHWYTIPASIAGNTITFSITDGGLGDDDLAANGAVVDAGGPGAPPAGARFFPLPPCRVGDTRRPNGPLDGPSLQPGATRTFAVAGACGIPSGAVAISADLAVTNAGAVGELVAFPSDVARPISSSISFVAGRTRANNGVVVLSGSNTSFSVFNSSAASVDFILDVNGYFQ